MEPITGPNAQRKSTTELDGDVSDTSETIAYEMAYGLSHELNNPLANIASRARLLAEAESDPAKRQQLAIIVDQAMRGCEMIADLMLLARPPVLQSKSIPVTDLLNDIHQQALPWCQARQLELTLHRDASLGFVLEADPVAIKEALWAVLRNAIEVAKSRIEMVTSLAKSDSIPTLRIEITDDGPGLSLHALAHAFHPYFSGREAGRGLGLGLSKARRIIMMVGGTLTIAAAPQGGCLAEIIFPQSQSQPDA